MNKTKFLDYDIIFGTYFLGQWIEKINAIDVQDALSGFQKNPFKNIPLFIKVAIEETAFLNGQELEITLFELSQKIDNVGGVQSKEVQDLLSFFIGTLQVKSDEAPTKSIAPKKK